MTEIFAVLINDRHCDTDVQVFTTEAAATRYAEEEAARYRDVDFAYELNESMLRDGWVRYIPFGGEGESIRVTKRELLQR